MAAFSISYSFCSVLRSLYICCHLMIPILHFFFLFENHLLHHFCYTRNYIRWKLEQWSFHSFIKAVPLSIFPSFLHLSLCFFISLFFPLLLSSFDLWSMFWGNFSLQPYRCVCTSLWNLNNILILIINLATWL